MQILKVVFVIIGALIGAGFASGQEIYTFFFSFGVNGLIGIVVSSFVMGVTIYKTLQIVCRNDIGNYGEFLNYFFKNKKLKEISNAIINIFILISFYIMIAGFGAYLNQEYGLNSIVGSSVLAILCLILFESNVSGFVKANEILIPILIVVIVLIRNC